MRGLNIAAGFALAAAAPNTAQTGSSVQFPAGWAPSTSVCVKQVDGSCIPVSASIPLPALALAKQEALALATSNGVASPVTAYGGDYIFAQSCTSYGTLTLQVRGPDGATWSTVATYTAADPGGGVLVTLGSAAVVRVALTGTTGCNATLSRVPR